MTKKIRKNSRIIQSILTPLNPYWPVYDAISKDITALMLVARQLSFNTDYRASFQRIDRLITKTEAYIESKNLKASDFRRGIDISGKATVVDLLKPFFIQLDSDEAGIGPILVKLEKELDRGQQRSEKKREFITRALPEILGSEDVGWGQLCIPKKERLGYGHYDLWVALKKTKNIINVLHAYFEFDPDNIRDKAIGLACEKNNPPGVALKKWLEGLKEESASELANIHDAIEVGFMREMTKWMKDIEIEFFSGLTHTKQSGIWTVEKDRNTNFLSNVSISIGLADLKYLIAKNTLGVALHTLGEELISEVCESENDREKLETKYTFAKDYRGMRGLRVLGDPDPSYGEKRSLDKYSSWCEDCMVEMQSGGEGDRHRDFFKTESILRGLLFLNAYRPIYPESEDKERTTITETVEHLNVEPGKRTFCGKRLREFGFQKGQRKLAVSSIKRDVGLVNKLTSPESEDVKMFIHKVRDHNTAKPYLHLRQFFTPRWML